MQEKDWSAKFQLIWWLYIIGVWPGDGFKFYFHHVQQFGFGQIPFLLTKFWFPLWYNEDLKNGLVLVRLTKMIHVRCLVPWMAYCEPSQSWLLLSITIVINIVSWKSLTEEISKELDSEVGDGEFDNREGSGKWSVWSSVSAWISWGGSQEL